MHRRPVSKSKSARSFRKQVQTTKILNVRPTPQRGGFKL